MVRVRDTAAEGLEWIPTGIGSTLHEKVRAAGKVAPLFARIDIPTNAGIPKRAHDYQLGSRSAIDWIVYSYQIKTDTASGIVNDPNDWATEHDDPSYILDLIGRVVTVSMRTIGIIDGLPKLAL